MEGYWGSPDLSRTKHSRSRRQYRSHDANNSLEELRIHRNDRCAIMHELDIGEVKVDRCDLKLDILDFKYELDGRNDSTSTPFVPKTLSYTNIQSCDSCFSESAVASSFASSCRIRSRINKSCDSADKSHCGSCGYATGGDDSLGELDRLPLPRLSLYSEFMSMDDSPADEPDSAFCSFSSSHVDVSSDVSLCVTSPRFAGIKSCPVCRCDVQAGVCQYCITHTDSVFTVMLRQCLLTDPEYLIGRKMGDDAVDIISELNGRSLHSPLAMILVCLSEEDLCRMCCVSRQWKSVCENNIKAHRRRRQFIKSHRVSSQDKENLVRWKRWSPSRLVTGAKEPLAKVQCLAETSDCISLSSPPALSCSDKFLQEARQLRIDERLCRCPKCEHPARVHSVQERAWCTSEMCKYDFCIRCHSAFHGAQDCSQVMPGVRRPKTDSNMCSKRSKRNLKRL